MKPEDIVREACIVAYNMRFTTFLDDVFQIPDDHYSRGKFNLMKSDFGEWFCGLDSKNANKFMVYVLKHMVYVLQQQVDQNGNDYVDLLEGIAEDSLGRVDSYLVTQDRPRKWSVLLQYPGQADTFWAWVLANNAESAVAAARSAVADGNNWGETLDYPVLLVIKGHIKEESPEGGGL